MNTPARPLASLSDDGFLFLADVVNSAASSQVDLHFTIENQSYSLISLYPSLLAKAGQKRVRYSVVELLALRYILEYFLHEAPGLIPNPSFVSGTLPIALARECFLAVTSELNVYGFDSL